MKAVDRGNQEVGSLGEIPREWTAYPRDSELRVYRGEVRREGVHFRFADVARRENMPADVFGRDNIRVEKRYPTHTRPSGDVGDFAADTATSGKSDMFL